MENRRYRAATWQRLDGVRRSQAFVVELMRPSQESESIDANTGFALRRQLENVCVQARDLAEAAARSALQKRAVDAAEPFAHFSAPDKACATAAGPRPAGGGRRDGRQDPGDRPAHPGARLRVLAPDAVRPVPGREPPAHAPGRRGGQPGGVRGAGPVGEGRRTASSWRRGTPAGCCRRSSAPTTCCWRSSSPIKTGSPLEKLLASLPAPGLHRRRQPGLGLPVLADQEEGRGQQERRRRSTAGPCPP